jgi:DNA-binding transcriptional ArsR family regulator
MDKFYALSAPIRREIIALLAEGNELTATAIAESFRVSPPAISQHLKVLLNTDLVHMHKQAQQRIYQLNPAALLELENWAKQMVKNFDPLRDLSKLIDNKDADASA